MWTWRKNPGNVVGTHPVPVRWAAGEEGGSPPAAGGRAATPPGTPARSSCPAGICPAQGGKKQQCCGSVTFLYGSGSSNPDLQIGNCDQRIRGMRIRKPLKHTDPTDPDPHPNPEHWYIYVILQR
jgi:hypothetical protein